MQRYTIDQLPSLQRDTDGHKGTYGRVLVVGGSRGMSGSVCLTGKAALRGGAGLVSVAVPESIQSVVAGYEASYMTIGLPEERDGSVAEVRNADELIDGKDVVAVGPGLGQTRSVADLVLSLLNHADCPVVLDADALNAAAEYDILQHVEDRPPCILTPHPGEFARLTGQSISDISDQREASAGRYARENGVVVVLKGAGTVVTDGERVYVNETGNPGMATGGSGDVLTGIVAAQVAQGLSPFEAAVLAVFVHGVAGDLAAEEWSQRGLIASDLLCFLGAAWRNIRNSPSI